MKIQRLFPGVILHPEIFGYPTWSLKVVLFHPVNSQDDP